MTPFEYLLRYRIYVSAIKLCQPENALLSIAELADASGFGNASYYNKIFKKYLHCTPSEYRQKNGMITSPCRNILPGDTEFFHPLP